MWNLVAWLCDLYPGNPRNQSYPVLPTTLSSRQMAEHLIIFAETDKESFIRMAGHLSWPSQKLRHNISEQIAGNSLRPLPHSQRRCSWPSSDSILAQTSAGNSPSLLYTRSSNLKLSSPVNRWSQTSTGNSFSLQLSRTSFCRLPSVEKASACNLLRSFPPKSSSCKWLSPANDLDQTFEDNSPSLLDLRLSFRKLLRPAKRSGHTSAGNLLSELYPRLRSCNFLSPEKAWAGITLSELSLRSSSCKLLSPEKTPACNLLRSFPPKSSSCKWLSPANDLDQTFEDNSPSLLDLRLSFRKLLRPAKRSGHTSAGNLLSLFLFRSRSCKLRSPEKTPACNSLRSFWYK